MPCDDQNDLTSQHAWGSLMEKDSLEVSRQNAMMNNLCNHWARGYRFALAMLGVFSIILPFTSCVAAAERDHNYPRKPRSGAVDPRGIEGVWFITANDVSGRLEFFWTRNGWTGRIQYLDRPWEELIDVFLDDHTGKLQFARLRNNQQYVGTLSGNQISGTFTEGGGSYPWVAWRP